MRVRDFDDEQMPGSLLDLGDTHAFSPNPLPPELNVGITDDIHHAALDAMYAIGRLQEIGDRIDNPRMIQLPFIYREAVDSSEIEGTRVTLPDLYAFDATDSQGAGDHQRTLESYTKSLQEVRNYVAALETGIERLRTDEEITLALLQELHVELLGQGSVRSHDPNPGEFREQFVNIGGGRFVPPPPDSVRSQMQTLEQYIQTGSEYDALIDVALVHYQLETVHPFVDGNGRVGRLLIALMLCDRGLLSAPYLHLSEFIKRRKTEYTEHLLAVSQRGAWEEWLRFFLRGLARQAANTCGRANELIDLRESYRSRYQEDAASVRRLAMELFTTPVVTVPLVSELLDCTYPTANRAVEQLEADGLLEEVTGYDRNRKYHAVDVFAIMDAPPSTVAVDR